MTITLFITAILFDVAGVAYSSAYLWLNIFSDITDLKRRNDGFLNITRTSMLLSVLISLLSCLLAPEGDITSAIANAGLLFSIIAISWLVIIFLCGAAILTVYLSKKYFKPELQAIIGKLFTVAIWGAVLGMLLSWLFS